MKALIHQFCGKIAFVFSIPPVSGDILRSENIFYPSGKRTPIKGEDVKCDSCGFTVFTANLNDEYLKDYEE